jgi:DNA-directed RNA polymerase subunit omega
MWGENMITMDNLIAKCGDSKYTLVVLSAKRSRELVEENWPDDGKICHKMVLRSLEEIDSGEVTFERVKSGVK